MIRHFGFILLCSLFLQSVRSADASFKAGQDRIADLIEKIPASNVKLFLYSLNPNDERIFSGKLPENSDKVFHRYPILGSVEIKSVQEKADLLRIFAKGIRENDSLVADCFNPRHGIRVVTTTSTNDFVICFECLQVHPYGFNGGNGFLTSGSPNAAFNKVLDEYKVKKADE